MFWNTQRSYDHSWANVTLAIWTKYPNPFASHVLTVDVIDRQINNNIITTTRLFTKKGRLPSWAKAFKVSEAYILEVSTVNRETKVMTVQTRNLSHSKLLLVEETQTITELDESATNVGIKVRIVSNTSFVPIRRRIEDWGLSRFRKSTLNSSKGLDYVLLNIKRDGLLR